MGFWEKLALGVLVPACLWVLKNLLLAPDWLWERCLRFGRWVCYKLSKTEHEEWKWCNTCWWYGPDPLLDPTQIPDDASPEWRRQAHWYRCPNCGRVGGVRSVVTQISPVPEEHEGEG